MLIVLMHDFFFSSIMGAITQSGKHSKQQQSANCHMFDVF
jgi:hypothetical protein